MGRNHALTAFIIGIGALGNVDSVSDFFLSQVGVFPQGADPFIFLIVITRISINDPMGSH